MRKSVFFIDGYNLYHSLKNLNNPKYKWLDIKALVSRLTKNRSNEEIGTILYFTAKSPWSISKRTKHETYIKALIHSGIETILGKFQKVKRKCRKCHKTYTTYEEKYTDVNIGVQMYREASKKKHDKFYLISADSDLIPAINAIKKDFPEIKIGVVLPLGHKSYDLINNCDFVIYIKKADYNKSLFPEKISLPNEIIECPVDWK